MLAMPHGWLGTLVCPVDAGHWSLAESVPCGDGGRSSVGRAPGCGPGSRGFTSPRPPQAFRPFRATSPRYGGGPLLGRCPISRADRGSTPARLLVGPAGLGLVLPRCHSAGPARRRPTAHRPIPPSPDGFRTSRCGRPRTSSRPRREAAVETAAVGNRRESIAVVTGLRALTQTWASPGRCVLVCSGGRHPQAGRRYRQCPGNAELVPGPECSDDWHVDLRRRLAVLVLPRPCGRGSGEA